MILKNQKIICFTGRILKGELLNLKIMLVNLLNERIFVAGSSGMVGSSICKSIKKLFISSNSKNKLLTPSREELNLLDNLSVESWFRSNKPTILIIAAAKVGGIAANETFPADFLIENLRIQTNLLEAASRNNLKRVMFLGSSCIYPKFSKQPIKEEYLLSGKLEYTNQSYAIAKIAGIKLCESLRKQYGLDAISLMPTNLYGPKDNYHLTNSHVMASFIRKFCEASKKQLNYVTCWGTGSPLREFLHVDDLAQAVIFCLENWDPESNVAPKDIDGRPLLILNVGTGKDITIKKLAELVALKAGYKGEILWDNSKPDGTPKKQLDISKINSLGWRHRVNLEEGIEKTVTNYKNNY